MALVIYEMSKPEFLEGSVEYEELRTFANGLLKGTSEVGKIISPASIKESVDYMRKVYEDNLIANGAAVRIGSN